MNQTTQNKLIEDIAYIKGKVENLPDLQKRVRKNSQSISRIKGIMGTLGVLAGLAIPYLSKFFVGK